MAQANPIHVNARRVVAAAFRAFLLSVDYPSLSPPVPPVINELAVSLSEALSAIAK